MIQLARIQLTDEMGRELSLRAMDVRLVTEFTGGSVLVMDNGQTLRVTASVTTVHNAIDTLLDEYHTALGDPA
jgi:hypothetical protein